MDFVVGEEQAEGGGGWGVFGDDEDALVADQAMDVRLAAHRLDEVDGGVDWAVRRRSRAVIYDDHHRRKRGQEPLFVWRLLGN